MAEENEKVNPFLSIIEPIIRQIFVRICRQKNRSGFALIPT